MALVTLSDLITRTRARAEIASSYVADATLTAWLNASIAELWRFIAETNEDWLICDTPQTITVVSGTAAYGLYPDHWLLAGVDVLESSDWRSLRPYSHSERNRNWPSNSSGLWRYRIAGTQLLLNPTPDTSGSVRVWFVPTPPVLASTAITGGAATVGSATVTGFAATTGISAGMQVAVTGEPRTFRVRSTTATTVTLDRPVTATATVTISADTMDAIAGFDEFVILATAIKYLALEESDPSIYMAQLGDAKASIRTAVARRDVSEPLRIRDWRRELLSEEENDATRW